MIKQSEVSIKREEKKLKTSQTSNLVRQNLKNNTQNDAILFKVQEAVNPCIRFRKNWGKRGHFKHLHLPARASVQGELQGLGQSMGETVER